MGGNVKIENWWKTQTGGETLNARQRCAAPNRCWKFVIRVMTFTWSYSLEPKNAASRILHTLGENKMGLSLYWKKMVNLGEMCLRNIKYWEQHRETANDVSRNRLHYYTRTNNNRRNALPNVFNCIYLYLGVIFWSYITNTPTKTYTKLAKKHTEIRVKTVEFRYTITVQTCYKQPWKHQNSSRT